MIETADIEHAVVVLMGKSLWKWTRAADLVSFHFGTGRSVRTFYGDTREVGEFVVNVQCAWRISQDNTVVVGNGDLYYPPTSADEQRIPEFDWDHGPNRCDEILARLFQNRRLTVVSIHVGVAARLRLGLSEGFSLEIFPNDSLGDEYWRLFRPDTEDDPHFVVGTHSVTRH